MEIFKVILLIDIISAICILSGCFFVVTGTVGFLKFPDIFTRMHASSLIETGGLGLIASGFILQSIVAANYLLAIKLFILVLLTFTISPAITYMFVRALLHFGISPRAKKTLDYGHTLGDDYDSDENDTQNDIKESK